MHRQALQTPVSSTHPLQYFAARKSVRFFSTVLSSQHRQVSQGFPSVQKKNPQAEGFQLLGQEVFIMAHR
jgi:hypothetical protein